MKELPTQLHNTMIDGLTMLLALRLTGSPAADTVAATAKAWSRVLAHGREWDEERDLKRFQTAFMVLAAETNRWPSPRDFLDVLPPPPAPPMIEYRYNPTAVEKAKGKSALKQISDGIKAVLNGKIIEPGKPETFAEQILRNRAKVEELAKREREKGN
ncbi:hypothetical protein [Neisseria musculi]|uniref:Uncharacterized protein n=1 Tax=Neisseria musculi TaxID=1815583 RepID=A0A7H1MDF7_9NEIS|nr:hypothetical protein [Neisseria musculi]QNT59672.1 hypothetical protein H7A79_1138 [Neisseria musculi]